MHIRYSLAAEDFILSSNVGLFEDGYPRVVPNEYDVLVHVMDMLSEEEDALLSAHGFRRGHLMEVDDLRELWSIVPLHSVRCSSCGGYYIPAQDELDQLFSQSAGSFDPTDFTCPSCEIGSTSNEEVYELLEEMDTELRNGNTNQAANLSTMIEELRKNVDGEA